MKAIAAPGRRCCSTSRNASAEGRRARLASGEAHVAIAAAFALHSGERGRRARLATRDRLFRLLLCRKECLRPRASSIGILASADSQSRSRSCSPR
jgi:hypothetical protein